MVTDIILLKIMSNNDLNQFNIALVILAYLLVLSQKMLLLYEFFYLISLLVESRL
jgi:hypothetical protein